MRERLQGVKDWLHDRKLDRTARSEAKHEYMIMLDRLSTIPFQEFDKFPRENREKARYLLEQALLNELSSIGSRDDAQRLLKENRDLSKAYRLREESLW